MALPKNCSVELTALIYGILNAVLTGGIFLACIGLIIYVSIEMAFINSDPPLLPHRTTSNQMALELVHLAIFGACAIVAFTFAVLLNLGITKKRPAFVLTYFIFGILVTLVSLGVIIAYEVAASEPIITGVGITVCVIYAVPLIAVFMAFKKIRSDLAGETFYNPLG